MMYYGSDYDDNSLKHYGVIGMKWGIHRSNKLRAKAAGGKYGQGTKKAMKLAKAKKIEAKGRALGGAAYDYTKKQGWAKTALKTGLYGSYGALNYNKSKAKGNGRIASAVMGKQSDLLNVASGGYASFLAPRASTSEQAGRKRAAANAAYKKAKRDYRFSGRPQRKGR